MKTIYKIIGGGQKVRQNVQYGVETEYIECENDWSENAKCAGQDHFTGVMWHEDLETLQEWANAWAGEEVELVKKED